ncbi:hypothetical protein POL72_47340 [Sorangium sp. wiwo2]|uniref:Secreted protein n=1 Tax=Sorangium atrum TaxID=2995308 RepID=A0ABT5CG54_9BACT|nr:hypothetical protein [Sorangium aterium]MDC0685412.1 hypothetical protein [Sorangium aterium]
MIPTAAMLMLAICSLVSPNSPLMTGISGATANHAKKQAKNASQVKWNARIAGVDSENSSILVALVAWVMGPRKVRF